MAFVTCRTGASIRSPRPKVISLKWRSRKIHRNEALRRAIGLSVLPLLFFLPTSWLLIRWVVRRSMSSLIRLQQEIGKRDGSNLTTIPELPMPTELVPIHTAVNRLLDRLQRALMSERQFAANSAHELRTPIAAVQAQLQVLAAQLAGTQHADQALRIVGQVKALGNLAKSCCNSPAQRRGWR